jgi:hypothetical protein
MDLTSNELSFIEQREIFLESAIRRVPNAPAGLAEVLARPPAPTNPLIVDRLDLVTDAQYQTVSDELYAGSGIAHIIPEHFSLATSRRRHPLLALAHQLQQRTDIGYPIPYPSENHPEAAALFGPPDGTVKIYVPPSPDKQRPREHGEMFGAHTDGLGYAGLVYTIIFCLDSPPLSGGFTYFQNLLSVAVALAKDDPEAFASLFLPDAITVVVPAGNGAIKVQAPVFYLGRDGKPQVFFRTSSLVRPASSKKTEEIAVTWRDLEALSRAQRLLEDLARPFAPSSRFVQLMRPGETIIINNRHVVHGRTPYVDPGSGTGRVLSRKWFAPTQQDAVHRHAPSVEVDARFARLFPDAFSTDRLRGDWHYDPEHDENILVASRNEVSP